MDPLLLILGHGAVGRLVAARAVAAGWRVIGVRRSACQPQPGVVALRGDGADPELHRHVARAYGMPRSVLLAANPGLRGGGDNGLVAVARAAAAQWPQARRVAIGSTAVYADSGARTIDETGSLARGARARGLLAIEAACLRAGGLVLRAGALAGLRRARTSERLRHGRMAIRGGSRRALSWVHEEDLAAVVWIALQGGLGTGVINLTASCWPSVASFHRRYAVELGWPLVIEDAPGTAPERRVASPALVERGGPALRTAWWT